MSRNVIIGGIVVIALAVGGWWYFNQSSAPAISETTQLPTTQQTTQQNTNSGTQSVVNTQPSQPTQTSPVPFNRATIQIGDHAGGFIVTDIKPISGSVLNRQDPEGNMEVAFNGSVELRGTFSRKTPAETYASLKLTAESKQQLPFDSSWGAPDVVLIENPKSLSSGILEGDAVVVVTGRYNYRMFPSETFSTIMALSIRKDASR